MLKASFSSSKSAGRGSKGWTGLVLVAVCLVLIGTPGLIAPQAAHAGGAYLTQDVLQQGVNAAAEAAGAALFIPSSALYSNVGNMYPAAQSMLDRYGIQPLDPVAENFSVEACLTLAEPDPVLCTEPPRKLVRVRVTAAVGADQTPVTAESVFEAPSLDIVLVLDTSESMAYGAAAGTPLRDPHTCNLTNDCQPFQEVKAAASNFAAASLSFPYDRLSVVSFDQYAHLVSPMSLNSDDAREAIYNLSVYEGLGRCPYSADLLSQSPYYANPSAIPAPPPVADPGYTPYTTDPGGPCRLFSAVAGTYQYMDCPMDYSAHPDPSRCGSTNIADALNLAGAVLAGDYSGTSLSAPWPDARPDVKHVVVLLTDGAANAAYDASGAVICPTYTWSYSFQSGHALCQDNIPFVRHSSGDPLYDADDYARDAFDRLAASHVTIDTIGMGSAIRHVPSGQTQAPGESLLQYPALPPYQGGLGAGLYFYFMNDGDTLKSVFHEVIDSMGAAALVLRTPTPTASSSPTATATATVTLTPPPTSTPTPTQTRTRTPTRTITLSPTVTLTWTPSFTPTITQTPTETFTRTTTRTRTQTRTLTITTTRTVTVTPTPTLTDEPSSTSTATSTPTETATPEPVETITPTVTLTFTPTAIPTVTLTSTPTLTPTDSLTPGPTSTATFTPTLTPVHVSHTISFRSVGVPDGWVRESSETSGVGGALNSTATTFQLGDDALNRQYKAILSFNTSSLPAGAVITSAVLKIAQSGLPVGTNPFTTLGSLSVDLRKGAFGGNPALQLADFNAAPSAARVAYFSATPGDPSWYSAMLNTAGRNNLNRAGVTQVRLYFAMDDNNNHVADFMKFVSGNASKNTPILLVTYYLP